VFAIRDIPKGTLVFGSADEAVLPVAETEVLRLTGEERRLYDDFCVVDAGHYMCPRSFNEITVAWYVNHSETPNLACDAKLRFVASRRIRKGEELTADYRTYAVPIWATASPTPD
jgi:hypothetical protein